MVAVISGSVGKEDRKLQEWHVSARGRKPRGWCVSAGELARRVGSCGGGAHWQEWEAAGGGVDISRKGGRVGSHEGGVCLQEGWGKDGKLQEDARQRGMGSHGVALISGRIGWEVTEVAGVGGEKLLRGTCQWGWGSDLAGVGSTKCFGAPKSLWDL